MPLLGSALISKLAYDALRRWYSHLVSDAVRKESTVSLPVVLRTTAVRMSDRVQSSHREEITRAVTSACWSIVRRPSFELVSCH
jgi:hypothetical protein